MSRRKTMLVGLVLLNLLLLGGCKFEPGKLLKSVPGKDEGTLIKAEIVFTDGQQLSTYLKTLGIEDEASVYVGGSAATNMYDARGNITGVFNYQRVLFIRVLPPDKSPTGS